MANLREYLPGDATVFRSLPKTSFAGLGTRSRGLDVADFARKNPFVTLLALAAILHFLPGGDS